MKKRIFSIILTICMVFMLMPTTVFAADIVGDNILTEWTTGQYEVKGEVIVNSNITVSGDVCLILADGCKLIINGNINGGSLTIKGQAGGTGTLDVKGCITGGMGSRGNTEDPISGGGGGGSNITINGGVVMAESITGGSGGSGFYAGNGGNITISDGVIEAKSITGGNSGSGNIGGTGGSVTITGGVVEAENITGGTGDTGYGGNVTITGGVVDALSITGGGAFGGFGNKNITGGMVFENGYGEVVNTSVTLSESFTINDNRILTIESGKTLIISDGVTLTINGTVNNNGTINNNGKIYVDGTFKGTADNLYYQLILVDAIASGDTSEYNSKIYGKVGSTIFLSATPQAGKIITWNSSPNINISGNSFTMPKEVLTVTTQYKDITAPIILGIEEGKTYCDNVEFEVSDNDGIASVKAGNEVLIVGTNGKYTLDAGVGTITVVAIDYTGNIANVTLTVNDGHTDENTDHICDICRTTLSQHSGGTATCTSKAICEYCGEKYGELDSSNHHLEKVPAKEATVTEVGNQEYWYCKDCGKYFLDQDGKKSIELKNTITQKLSPQMIEGIGQSITVGEAKDLIFRSNAAFSDFIRVELDGKILDEKYYTVKEGSTIVTLKAEYVSTLSSGEHTIGIVSESGTAAITFNVEVKTMNNNSPMTGDNHHMLLWIALLFVSGITVMKTMIMNKKHSED